MIAATTVVVLVLVSGTLGAHITMTFNDLNQYCSANSMHNGLGHTSHPTDCEKYVQCYRDSLGNILGRAMPCGFGTYWNQAVYTCTDPSWVSCPHDKCLHDTSRRHSATNCRGYWECQGGKSVAKCCPSGQYFNDTLQVCEDHFDEECTASCKGDPYVESTTASSNISNNDTDLTTSEPVTTNDTTTTTETIPVATCDKEAIAGAPNKYNWVLFDGTVKIPMSCPAGTVYWHEQCNCDRFDNAQFQSTCQPEVLLTFKDSHVDISGHNNHVNNEYVTVENGQAYFRSNVSQLQIPRFTNSDSTRTFAITMKYTPDVLQLSKGEKMTLFSNFDCDDQLPSILVTEDRDSIHAMVRTATWWGGSYTAETSIPKPPVAPGADQQDQELTYHFHDDKLTLQLGKTKTEIYAAGTLLNTKCAFYVGHAKHSRNFVGKIDEIAIYLCNPNV